MNDAINDKKTGLESLLLTDEGITNPETLVLFGYPKVGKTAAAVRLPGKVLYIDTENSTKAINKKEHKNVTFVRCNSFSDFRLIVKHLMEMKAKGKQYDFIVVDTVDELYDKAANELAIMTYNKQKDKNFPLNENAAKIAYGEGFKYKRDALKELINKLSEHTPHLVLIAHVSEKNAVAQDGMSTIKEIALEGKTKEYLSALVDAIGLIYRSGENENSISFSSDMIVGGSRIERLANKEFVISRVTEEGLQVDWSEIFLPNVTV